jgi:DAACS family dicarboxylate/amino acid:cation (Na+ or H+) symporter
MVVVPLVFSALTLGVAGIGDVRRLGRLGVRTLVMTLILSSASVAIGLTFANTVRPGARMSASKQAELRDKYSLKDADAVKKAEKAKSVAKPKPLPKPVDPKPVVKPPVKPKPFDPDAPLPPS